MKNQPLRCCRCGSMEFGLSGEETILIDIDAKMDIVCRQCLSRATGTLIDTGHLQFVEEDINE